MLLILLIFWLDDTFAKLSIDSECQAKVDATGVEKYVPFYIAGEIEPTVSLGEVTVKSIAECPCASGKVQFWKPIPAADSPAPGNSSELTVFGLIPFLLYFTPAQVRKYCPSPCLCDASDFCIVPKDFVHYWVQFFPFCDEKGIAQN